MSRWFVAPAIRVLIDTVNDAAPNRSKRTDGTIGDAKHAASKSEHNPNGQGAVRAWDCTHDPSGGVDCGRLAEDVIDELDRRGVKGYVIFRGRIRSTYVSRGVWRPYSGSNPHNHHMHVSIITGWQSTAPWRLPSLAGAVTTVVDPGRIAVDGDLGPRTRMRFAAVVGLDSFTDASWWRAVQVWAGLTGAAVDGVPGPQTWEAVRVKLGSGAGEVDGVVRAWQAWMNVQDTKARPPAPGMVVLVDSGAGIDAQDTTARPPTPEWPLPTGHLIYHNPKGYSSWHDGRGTDTAGRAAIRTWQERMRARGWAITVDGFYGDQTEDVARQFQAEKGLDVDGIIGPATWDAAWASPITG